MKKIMPLAASIALILIAGIFASAGSMAWFSDTETSGGNIATAGTLDLEVGSSPPATITVSDMKPGDDTGYYKWILKNTGTITGNYSIEFSAITNRENSRNEPERKAGDTGAPGELGACLRLTMGWGPSGWTGPSRVYDPWSENLDDFGGRTVIDIVYFSLGPGEEVGFFLKLYLDQNIRHWNGCSWDEVDDNIIQSDGVEFDLIFHLDQAP